MAKFKGCVLQGLGLELGGAALAAGGQPLVGTAAKTVGATPGTSVISGLLSQVFPQKLPFSVPVPTNTVFRGVMSKTNVVGRVLGRTAPWAGWAMLAWSYKEFAQCAY